MSKKTAPKKKPVQSEQEYVAPVPEAKPDIQAPPVSDEPVQGTTSAAPPEAPLTAQEAAYQAIASEIECQRLVSGYDEEPETVPEYILVFLELVEDLKTTYSDNRGPFAESPLDIVREIGATAVRCLEKNGALPAEMTQAMKLNLLDELAENCPEGAGLDPNLIREILYA
jgi:hypothetical protein